MSTIRIEVVSDVVCPWCFIGNPDGHPNSPTFGHFKIPHPDEHVTVQ